MCYGAGNRYSFKAVKSCNVQQGSTGQNKYLSIASPSGECCCVEGSTKGKDIGKWKVGKNLTIQMGSSIMTKAMSVLWSFNRAILRASTN